MIGVLVMTILIIWIAMGIADIYVVFFKKQKSISRLAEEILPRWADVLIVAAAYILAWCLFDLKTFVVALTYGMMCHMLIGHERYEKNGKN